MMIPKIECLNIWFIRKNTWKENKNLFRYFFCLKMQKQSNWRRFFFSKDAINFLLFTSFLNIFLNIFSIIFLLNSNCFESFCTWYIIVSDWLLIIWYSFHLNILEYWFYWFYFNWLLFSIWMKRIDL